MKKNRKDYWSNVFPKPKNFGFVKPLTYKCQIITKSCVYNGPTFKSMILEYDIFNGKYGSEIDKKSFMEKYSFIKDMEYQLFKRDGALFPFVFCIYVDELEMKKYIRKSKLKKVLL